LALGVIRLGPVLILAGLVIAMTMLSPVFLTTGNAGNLLSQTAAIAVLAIGQLLVILTRGIDLSVGSTLALASVLGAIAFAHGSSGWVVIIVMIATGAAVGFVNGAVYVWGRLPHPFIITLATLSIARGLALQFSGGGPNGACQASCARWETVHFTGCHIRPSWCWASESWWPRCCRAWCGAAGSTRRVGTPRQHVERAFL
ncbi:MAG: ABC transporter permease, partial [Ilumatobacteraceae bacterium]